jgi:hypothetical protein
MGWFALVTARSAIAVDLYRTREQAEEELRQAIEDEPEWTTLLSVVPVDLPEPTVN